MYTIETGVLPGSTIFFHTPSPLAKSMFFYPIAMGYFICDSLYKVTRKEYQSYLLLYVKKGAGVVIAGGKTFTLNEGDILLLDCYKYHSYSTSSWEIIWLHFDGNVSRDYYNLIAKQSSCAIHSTHNEGITTLLLNFIQTFNTASSINEALLSCQINQMLCELFTMSSNLCSTEIQVLSPVDQAIHYMQTHFKMSLSLDDIAYKVNLSPYYFTRLFKKETSRTPYDYLMTLRINESKYLLKNTSMLIKEIAFEVGFNSESSFMSSFKKITGFTPSNFRRLPL